jgi:NAD(P)-dependent dehydrogenase (short-subunit alcohol dehydrogenase family)
VSEVAGRVVVITGASSGIGRETARQFAGQGASVVLAARGEDALASTADEVTAAGGTPLVVPTDVADWEQVQALATSARERFGRIDTWVNNASVSGFGELSEMPVDAIERILHINLLGQVYGAKAAVPIMRAQGHGVIIGVNSMLGVRSIPLQIPYCMSKFATTALYEGLRLEERRAGSGVELTTILPSAIDTPFYDHAASWMGVRPAALPPVYQPAAVAEAIVFAADHPRRQIAVGGAGVGLGLLQRISPALTDRILGLADQIFVRQRTDVPDHGESNLWQPSPAAGTARGSSVGSALRRSLWTRTVGYHPAAIAAGAAAGAAALVRWSRG